MTQPLKQLGTLRLGALTALLVEDPQGRQCVALTLGDRPVCFTITQALLTREILDQAIQAMAQYTAAPPASLEENKEPP